LNEIKQLNISDWKELKSNQGATAMHLFNTKTDRVDLKISGKGRLEFPTTGFEIRLTFYDVVLDKLAVVSIKMEFKSTVFMMIPNFEEEYLCECVIIPKGGCDVVYYLIKM